jgi:DnaJ-class molecular chaperone
MPRGELCIICNGAGHTIGNRQCDRCGGSGIDPQQEVVKAKPGLRRR